MKRNKHSSSISIDEYFRKLSRVEYVNAVAQPASTSDSGSATQPTPMESSQSTGKYNLQIANDTHHIRLLVTINPSWLHLSIDHIAFL